MTTTTITYSSLTITTTLTGAMRGSVYTIQVQPSNTLGIGSIVNATIGMCIYTIIQVEIKVILQM